MNSETRVIIADDHPIFRRGLRAVIETDAQIKVMAEAGDGEAALACIRQHAPDIAILDLDMPVKDGFAVTREIRESKPSVKVIILTMHDKESLFNAALDLGVKGFVLKDSAMPEIIDCIKAVMSGRNYISPQLSTYLIGRGNRRAALAQETPTLKDLTPAEQHILKLIADEKTSRQIADTLHISIRTVDRHRANICDKLNLHGSNALVKFAVAHKSDL
jgi:DNA-binding NarL/FixJ family response regulator